VMNPPFSEGRWQAHIEHAATLLNDGGRLVAIVPASARGKDVLPGFSITWSDVMNNEFANTSIAVVVMAAERANP
jgi:16S rRNA G1207 methylase RsmC